MNTKKLDTGTVRVAVAYHLIEKANKLLGPEREQITIGRFVIERPGPSKRDDGMGTIWIQDAHGSGVEFLEVEWESVIKKYFDFAVTQQNPSAKADKTKA